MKDRIAWVSIGIIVLVTYFQRWIAPAFWETSVLGVPLRVWLWLLGPIVLLALIVLLTWRTYDGVQPGVNK